MFVTFLEKSSKGSEMVLQHRITLLLLIFSCLIVLTDSCNNRCLANMMINKKMKSAPQGNTCSVNVSITSIKYETMSFDTKNMQMSSRIKVNMVWRDLELQWNTTISDAEAVMLPVDKIWTPELVLENVIDVTVKPYTHDVQVNRDGLVDYSAILFISVSCNDINLFNYPFVHGECSVAINGWNQSKCEVNFIHPPNVSIVGGIQGEWETLSVIIEQDQSFQNSSYLSVSLSISPFSAVVTLILPSVLIMLADLVTFSLPVQGGERNSLKVTLVLSFTMFLLILNDHLSSGGRCSPILHYHFCFCLVNLVFSMMVSICLTRLTLNDTILSWKCSKNNKKHKKTVSLGQDEDAGVIATKTFSDLPSEVASLQKVVTFLENIDQKAEVTSSNESFVDGLDKICFCFFLFIDIIYIIVVVIITRTDLCKEKRKELWVNEDFYDPPYTNGHIHYYDNYSFYDYFFKF
ncbi:zinc-activated ligand-gated ion channel [Pimephales promelas]|uniref:zinc-activated ligand-gated ion channel n=1 Tax=Pimephales promelas TaxID=90988 RepID=UPI001955A3A5|nr:zinc-activated ligand-gated ion channel [Pimephales promelas]